MGYIVYGGRQAENSGGQEGFRMRFRIGICLAAAAISLSPVAAWSQIGWNIDLDDDFAPPEGGGGLPSSDFGAAAGEQGRGYWNYLDTTGDPPTQLRGLDGVLTPVVVTGPTSGGGGGNNFRGNTGDFALLLNDGRLSPSGDTWTVSGLEPGKYKTYVYAVAPDDRVNPTVVTVAGIERIVTGPMPGNRFEVGVTHAEIEFDLIGNSFDIRVDRGQFRNAWINGFQVMAVVPEPGTLAVVSFALLFLRSRKRRS